MDTHLNAEDVQKFAKYILGQSPSDTLRHVGIDELKIFKCMQALEETIVTMVFSWYDMEPDIAILLKEGLKKHEGVKKCVKRINSNMDGTRGRTKKSKKPQAPVITSQPETPPVQVMVTGAMLPTPPPLMSKTVVPSLMSLPLPLTGSLYSGTSVYPSRPSHKQHTNNPGPQLSKQPKSLLEMPYQHIQGMSSTLGRPPLLEHEPSPAQIKEEPLEHAQADSSPFNPDMTLLSSVVSFQNSDLHFI